MTSPYRTRGTAPAGLPVESERPYANRWLPPIIRLGNPLPEGLPKFLMSYGVHPLWAKHVVVNRSVPRDVRVSFSEGIGKEVRHRAVALSGDGIAAAGPTHGGVLNATIRMIREGLDPEPLLCDVQSFRRRALRWFRCESSRKKVGEL